jgi:hypothetical protein
MPAVLNEAFRSPFDKISGQGHRSSDSDTHDIRNAQDLDFSGLSGGPPASQQYQQNYAVSAPHTTVQSHPTGIQAAPALALAASPSSGITWGAQAQTPVAPMALQPGVHDCDRLIGEIMGCAKCRQKLRRLMAAWDDDHPKQVEERPEIPPRQEGGAIETMVPGYLKDIFSSSPGLITNIIMGIAILFLLDRILQLRLTR